MRVRVRARVRVSVRVGVGVGGLNSTHTCMHGRGIRRAV